MIQNKPNKFFAKIYITKITKSITQLNIMEEIINLKKQNSETTKEKITFNQDYKEKP